MSVLKTDYKDDILDSSVNVNRTFSIIDNTTGQIIYPNVSLEETTVFSQEGDSHTSQITNEQNTEINQLNNDLTANTKKFQFAYDNTKSKYGYTIDGTFYPFSGGGAIYLGQYSADTTIDVSDLGATSVDQFLIVCPTNGSASGYYQGAAIYNVSASATYTAPTITLANDTLTLTVGKVTCGMQHSGVTNLATQVYYVGDIETR